MLFQAIKGDPQSGVATNNKTVYHLVKNLHHMFVILRFPSSNAFYHFNS